MAKKIFLGLVGLVVVLVAAITIFWIFFLSGFITNQVKNRTGFDMKIQRLVVNPFTANAEIDGLLLTNPSAEFKTADFVNLQALHAKIDLFSVFKDTFVVESATFNLPSVTVVKPAAKPTNAELFAQRLMGESAPAPTPDKPTEPQEPAKPFKFLIKKLEIDLGDVVYVSESATGETKNKPVHIAYKYTYENVTKPSDFITKELAARLLAVGGQFTDLLPAKWGGKADSIIQSGVKALENPQDAAAQGVKGLLDKLKKK